MLTYGKSLIIGLVITGIYYLAMFDDGVPLQNQINSTNSEMEKSKAEMQSVRQAILDAARFEQTKDTLGAEMDRVLRAIPAKLNSTELMRILSNEAKEVGAQINQVSAPNVPPQQDANKSAFYEPVDVEIDISGSYNQVMLFLSNLTRLDKIVTMRKLSISLRELSGPSAQPVINLKASLSAHKSISVAATSGAAGGG
jgi:type IV pilus assembly protein PilO